MVWFLMVLAALLTAAKLTAITPVAAAMSWWLVTAPLWAPAAIMVVCFLLAMLVALIVELLK